MLGEALKETTPVSKRRSMPATPSSDHPLEVATLAVLQRGFGNQGYEVAPAHGDSLGEVVKARRKDFESPIGRQGLHIDRDAEDRDAVDCLAEAFSHVALC